MDLDSSITSSVLNGDMKEMQMSCPVNHIALSLPNDSVSWTHPTGKEMVLLSLCLTHCLGCSGGCWDSAGGKKSEKSEKCPFQQCSERENHTKASQRTFLFANTVRQ